MPNNAGVCAQVRVPGPTLRVAAATSLSNLFQNMSDGGCH